MVIDPNRAKEIFLEATEQPDAAARAAYLDRACAGNAGMRDRVEALLRSHDLDGSFLGAPAMAMAEPNGATQELGDAAPQTPRDQTVSLNGEGDDAMADNKKPDDDDLKFLAPSTRPGSLGRLGHYEMLQVLGKGGFGIVFRAFDDTLQRVVAVKVMASQIATLSPARKRFVREAQSSAKIRHEHVVHIYEVVETSRPYLVMEFIPGETLQQKLDRSGPLDVPEILRIGRQIAEGLAAAHACDLIHRDIKPGNILLEGGSHKAKITDFGLARAADDASISQSGVVAGTPMFMAPEQALGHEIDQRADLFSLGSVLYQMASGRPPFRAPTALAVLKRVAEETPRPIPEIIPETPDWLCGIITKLHAKNPDERFQSAREVADLLADCEAKLKTKQEVKNVLPKRDEGRGARGAKKWVAAAIVVLLPAIALGVMEFVGVTHLFRGQQATADPDRKAAEYVLSIGGEVQVDGRDRKIKAVGELPRDPFRLTWVGLMHSNQITDAGLANFKDCRNLTFLGLFDTSVSDEGLANFQNCTKLTFLNLARTKISDAGLANFKDCTELTIVVLGETKVGDTGLAYLKNSKKLTNLLLQKTKVTAAGIDALKKALPLCKIEWGSGVSQPLMPPTFKNSIGMEFVIVPKGKSWLGGGKDKLGDKEVDIPADFYLGKYEVTQEEWEKVMGENLSHFSRMWGGRDAVKDTPDADLKRFPVEEVSWDQCQLFVAKLNKLEKDTRWIYRLPKEEEWEYACRGGPMSGKLDSAFDFYFTKPTNTLLPELANFKHDKGLNRTCKVGSYTPNVLGLYDMHGNVWEWCDTWQAGDGISPRMQRGGCWNDAADTGRCRAASRLHDEEPTSHRHFALGLRLARVPSGAPSPEAKTPPHAVAPFDAAQAKKHQEAWAKHLGVDAVITNSVGMKLRLIPPGKFMMGSPNDEAERNANEGPQHEVALTTPFYMGAHDVTVGQFKAFVKATGYRTDAVKGGGAYRFHADEKWKVDPKTNWLNTGFEQSDEHPVVCVSWEDAKAFCEWLSKKEAKAYALPTEAQWEYSCRAGSTTTFSFGDDPRDLGRYAWFNRLSEWKSHPVGLKLPNAWGLYDMHGNVWQWTADRYAADYYTTSPRKDPSGPPVSDACVLRGGAWDTDAKLCRAAFRLGERPPSDRTTSCGFRVVVVGNLKSPTP